MIEFYFTNAGLIHTWGKNFYGNLSEKNILGYLRKKKLPFDVKISDVKWKIYV